MIMGSSHIFEAGVNSDCLLSSSRGAGSHMPLGQHL